MNSKQKSILNFFSGKTPAPQPVKTRLGEEESSGGLENFGVQAEISDLPCSSSVSIVLNTKAPNISASVSEAPADLNDHKPTRTYLSAYPVTTVSGRNRTFQYSWFQKWDWLEYSAVNNGAYCFACRKFASAQSDAAFITIGFRNWKHATEKGKGFSKHAMSQAHKNAVGKLLEQEKRSKTGDTIQKQLFDDTIEKNRYYVKCIAEVVQFIVSNQLSFRGDSGSEILGSDSNGLFLQMFEFSLKKDKRLAEILPNIPANAKYTSPDIQNDIIHAMTQTVIDSIMKEVQQSAFVAILADETRDKQNVEDLALALRYVQNTKATERCIAILELKSQDAENITVKILDSLKSIDLDLDKIIAQSYDGASVMKGYKGGVQALISRYLNRHILFLHCFNHQLHLVIVHAIEAIPEIKLFFTICEQLYVFFKKGRIAQIYDGKSLKRLMTQRWTGHLQSLRVIKSEKDQIVSTLLTVADSPASDNFGSMKLEAIGLLNQITNLSFCFFIEAMCKVLEYFEPVTLHLQEKKLNVEAAIGLVRAVGIQLQDLRTDPMFSNLLEAAKKNQEPEMARPQSSKRRRKLPQNYDDCIVDAGVNLELDFENEDLCLKRIYFCIIDFCTQELTARFQEKENAVIKAVCQDLLDADKCSIENLEPLISAVNHTQEKQKLLLNLPSEVQLLNNLVKERPSLEDFTDQVLKYGSAFQGVNLLNQAALVIPSSTATVEATFSRLTSILKPQRLSMTHKRKADLVILNYNKDLTKQMDLDKFVLNFAKQKSRKLLLL